MKMGVVAPQPGPETAVTGARGVIYARSSAQLGRACDDQVEKCDDWARQHGIEVKQQFVDFASAERTAIGELRRALAGGNVDILLITDENRLYRSIRERLKFIDEEIVARGLKCVCVETGIVYD